MDIPPIHTYNNPLNPISNKKLLSSQIPQFTFSLFRFKATSENIRSVMLFQLTVHTAAKNKTFFTKLTVLLVIFTATFSASPRRIQLYRPNFWKQVCGKSPQRL